MSRVITSEGPGTDENGQPVYVKTVQTVYSAPSVSIVNIPPFEEGKPVTVTAVASVDESLAGTVVVNVWDDAGLLVAGDQKNARNSLQATFIVPRSKTLTVEASVRDSNQMEGQAQFLSDVKLKPKAVGPLAGVSYTQAAGMPKLEDALGWPVDVYRSFHSGVSTATPLIGSKERYVLGTGGIPLVSFKTADSWKAVAAGKLDAVLDVQADALAALGKPFYLCYHHEPEVSPKGTPAEYVAAFARVMSRFAKATNVVFVQIMTAWSANPANKGFRMDDWLTDAPVLAWDPYNWAFTYRNDPWQEMSQIAAGAASYTASKGRRLGFAEFGCMEDPKDPQRRAAWIIGALKSFTKWGAEFACYFNVDDLEKKAVWHLDPGTPAFDAFRAFKQ